MTLQAVRTTRISTTAKALMLLCSVMTLCLAILFAAPTPAQAQTRGTDVSTPSAGNVFVAVPGTFSKADVNALLARINQIRKEACDKNYPDPRDSKQKLKPSDYVPLTWSNGLEQVALTRAAEASILQDHQRPRGGYVFEMKYPTISYAENLAWNMTSNIAGGIEQWYGEKNDWIKQNTNAVTGHYTSLINPAYTSIGLAAFKPSKASNNRGWGAVAGEFNMTSNPTSAQRPTGVSGSYDQVIEVASNKVSYSLSNTSITTGQSKTLTPSVTISFPDIYNRGTVRTSGKAYGTVQWRSSNTSIATVNSSGRVTARKAGNTNITMTTGNRTATAKVTCTINKANNPMKASGKTNTVKYSKVKKKNQTIATKKAFNVSKAQGKVTYKKASGNKKITIAKNGKVTVKKGLKKGTYRIKVKVTAAGNTYYKGATKTVTITVRVR